MGLYAMISHKMYKSGSFVLVGSLIFFFIAIGIIMPRLGGAPYGGGFAGSFSYLGKDIFQIIKSLIFHPGVIIKEAISVWKMGYIIFLFLPLLFIPFFSPFSLLPALPALIISLLSRLPNYYWIQNHYTASVIAPVFVSLIYGVRFLSDRSRDLNKSQVMRISLVVILVVSLYYNVMLSPSPISIFFWKRMSSSSYYYKTSYVIKERDRVLDRAIKEFISQRDSVSSQGSVNTGYLAHRREYYLFPDKIGDVDYVVLDRKRAHFVGDTIDEERYNKEFERLLDTYEVVFSYDEIYIFKRQRDKTQ
ncbi:hypothetical protein ES703_111149 [subsurface metagenome]